MKTMYHPTTSATITVPDSKVEEWSEQGWLKTKPKAVREAEAKADATK